MAGPRECRYGRTLGDERAEMGGETLHCGVRVAVGLVNGEGLELWGMNVVNEDTKGRRPATGQATETREYHGTYRSFCWAPAT